MISRRHFTSLAARTFFGAAAMSLRPLAVEAQERLELIHDNGSGYDYLAFGNTKYPKKVFVLFHGRNSSAQEIWPIADVTAQNNPRMLVLVPNGPVDIFSFLSPEQLEALRAKQPFFNSQGMRNWFTGAPAGATPQERQAAMQAAVGAGTAPLNRFLDSQLRQYGLKDSDMAMYGLDTGGMMALQSAIQRPEPCAAVVSQSGHFLGADSAASRPPVLIIRAEGEMANAQMRTIYAGSGEALRGLGVPVTEQTVPDTSRVNRPSYKAMMDFVDPALGLSALMPQPGRPAPGGGNR